MKLLYHNPHALARLLKKKSTFSKDLAAQFRKERFGVLFMCILSHKSRQIERGNFDIK